MANSREGSVVFVDTNDTTVAEAVWIVGIKYIGAASGTAVLKSQNSSGDALWEEGGASNVYNKVDIYCKDGINVTLTNSAKVYLYLKPR